MDLARYINSVGGFVTCEAREGRYRVVVRFPTLEQAQAYYGGLVRAMKRDLEGEFGAETPNRGLVEGGG